MAASSVSRPKRRYRSSISSAKSARLAAPAMCCVISHALGVNTCFVSVTGTDPAGRDVARMVAGLGGAEAHVLAERSRTTTLKTRYIAGTQQLLRADHETCRAASGRAASRPRQHGLPRSLPHYKVIVLSDYAKGVLSDGAAAELDRGGESRGSTVVVDPKGHDYAIYRGADVLKPNRPRVGACDADAGEQRRGSRGGGARADRGAWLRRVAGLVRQGRHAAGRGRSASL